MSLEALLREAEKRGPGLVISVLSWAEHNLRDYPWRNNRTPFRILVAEVLLKRTTATAVNRIYDKFIRKYDSFEAILNTEIGEISDDLVTIGYHNRRAEIFVEVAKAVLGEHNGVIPKSKEALVAIKHIGPYTAGAVLSLGYGIKASMVDSNVERVFSRYFSNSFENKPRIKDIYILTERILPERGFDVFNLGLLDIGGTVCTYRTLRCGKCPMRFNCDSRT